MRYTYISESKAKMHKPRKGLGTSRAGRRLGASEVTPSPTDEMPGSRKVPVQERQLATDPSSSLSPQPRPYCPRSKDGRSP